MIPNCKKKKEIYSTGEQKIGTWIDGKTLYRKVVKGNTPNTTNGFAAVNWVDNMDICINITGWIMYNNSYQFFVGKSEPPNDENNSNQKTRIIVNPNKTFQFMIPNNDSFLNKPFTVIIEYTKTTD